MGLNEVQGDDPGLAISQLYLEPTELGNLAQIEMTTESAYFTHFVLSPSAPYRLPVYRPLGRRTTAPV
jgi:hypothetical protein